MATGKLTVKAIEAIRREATAKQIGLYLWDTELRGFGCRAAPSGQVSWLFQHWIGGKGGRPNRLAFAHCPPMALDLARKEAEKLRNDANQGVDIVARKKELRVRQHDALHADRFGEVLALYFKMKSDGSRYWTDLEERFAKHVTPKIGKDTPLAKITKQDIRRLINEKESQERYGAARTLYVGLFPFFKWCVERDVIPASPMATIPRPGPAKVRDRILTDAELKAFWDACEKMPLYGPFYRMLLLTAQRREEVGAMPWSELDLDKRTWTIPGNRTKNGKEHLVHLSPQAIYLLDAIPRVGPHVFTSSRTSKHVGAYHQGKAKIDELLGIVIDPDQEGYDERKLWRVHDLRRTAASGMASLGFQPHVIERVLNHTSGATGGLVSVYQRYEYLEERKRAIEAWGNYVDKVVYGTQEANIVPFIKPK